MVADPAPRGGTDPAPAAPPAPHFPRLGPTGEGDDRAGSATAYAAAGFEVFPLHAVDTDGRCSCGRECGRDAGKHPVAALAPRGLLDATTDTATIAQCWALWPDANIGVRTGKESGIWVLDVDAGKCGEATIAALEARHGPLPPTWAAETGGGGLHLWWRHPGGAVPTSAGRVGPGVDVRGDGGYVVAPPSRHRSGGRYRWGEGWSPATVPLADAPTWLLALVAAPPRPVVPVAPIGEAVAEGARNASLASLAGAMRRRGCGEATILAALLAENAERCVPPLDPAEVERVARSVARYAPAPPPRIGRRRPAFVEFVGGKAVPR